MHKFNSKVINELLQRMKYLLGVYNEINTLTHGADPIKLEDSIL